MTADTRKCALFVGAVSRDLLVSGESEPDSRPGGGVHHGGLALARLDARVRVVTRVRRDDVETLLAALRSEQADVLALPSHATTTYRNDYHAAVDRHELKAASDPIGPDDIPSAWRDADLIQISPLHQRDVAPETAAVLHGFKGLDVQGLLRGTGREGHRSLPVFLAHIDVLQVSESDLPTLLEDESLGDFVQRSGVSEMLVTRGARGATLVTSRGPSEIPTRPVEGGYPVGAGDVFLAAYLLSRVRGYEPHGAAQLATRVCIAKIQQSMVPRDFRLQENDA